MEQSYARGSTPARLGFRSQMCPAALRRVLVVIPTLLVVLVATAADQGPTASIGLMQARGETRTVDFETDEATNLSLDASPQGGWLVFDLLGHLYRLDANGGRAKVLTQASGVALNITPAVSPDGRRIAFASDRSGQLNLWIMNADGTAPVALTNDQQARYVDPTWAPDGRSIAVVRRTAVPGYGLYFLRTELWRFPTDGSAPQVLVRPAIGVGSNAEQFGAPAFSPDGKFLYFHRSLASVCMPGLRSSRYRLQRLDLTSGEIVDVRPQPSGTTFDCEAERFRTEQETEPRVSPDGRFLAFALTSPKHTLSYRGHDFVPGTVLMIRDLASGEERQLGSSTATAMTHGLQQWLEINPSSISWTADSKSVLHAASGHIERVDLRDGRVNEIPFRAHVNRVLSEQLRPRRKLDMSDSFTPSLLQWPTTSPDGRSIVFVAAGRLWIARQDEPARQLLDDATVDRDALLYTPSWSPSGDEVAFTSWAQQSRGHVWRYSLRARKLRQVTQVPGRYLFPVWSYDGQTLAYLHNAAPTRMSPQRFESPFDDGAWDIVVANSTGEMRKIATIERPNRLSYGLDGRLRYLTRTVAAAVNALDLQSIDPAKLDTRIEMKIVPVPWFWPETNLSPDGKWVSVALSSRAFACEVSRFAGSPPIFDISLASGFDICRRLDRSGAWYSSWHDAETIEFTEGTSQISVRMRNDERSSVPVSVSVPRPRPADLLLRNATIISMNGKQRATRGDIRIVDRRIACVGTCPPTPGTRVMDVTGKFVVPGIIDTHDHTTRLPNEISYPGEWKARIGLAFGVTTRYDPYTRTRSLFPLADLTDSGRVIGPRSLGSADAFHSTVAEGGPLAYLDYEWPLRTAADAEFEVSWRARLGSPILKYYWQWNRAQSQLVLAAARANGTVGVTSEALSIHQDLSWIMDGQTMFEHMLAGLPIYSDVTQFLGEAGVVYTPTLMVDTAHRFTGEALYASPETLAKLDASRLFPLSRPQELSSDIQAEAAKDIAMHGGRVSIGSHGELPGLGPHLEMWMLSSAMGPFEALRAATINGAYKLGMEADLGSIEVGKLADLLVLEADPLQDIRNTIRIDSVVMAGMLYPREELVGAR